MGSPYTLQVLKECHARRERNGEGEPPAKPYRPSRDNRGLILAAAGKLALTLEGLAFLAMQADARRYSARGFPGQMDTARIRCHFYGPRSLIAKGVFEWVNRKGRTVRLTAKGRHLAADLAVDRNGSQP